MVNRRMVTISTAKLQKKTLEQNITKLEKGIEVIKYEVTKLDTEHPNFDKRKEKKEANLKNLTTLVEDKKKYITEVEKELTEQKEAIKKIETGETKVNLEDLNCLVEKMIKQDALNAVATV